MANGRQATAKRLNMAERSKQQMELHFPGFHSSWIWHRKTNDGFTTVPRTMPIVMQAIDAQSKGQPAGHTLLCLWARSPDNPVVVIENPATFAAEAGFLGERAVDTWRKRMRTLRDLWMIQTKPGPTGEFHYVLLLNPNAAMEWMRGQKMVQDGIYSRFIDRLMEVGAFGEIEAVHEVWKAQAEANSIAAAVAAAAAEPAAPKEIPAPPVAG
ncbi:hypothetical protein [Devosia sp.]|uniref:hypothetical protein n=1 Tax=Devosia sp. TaxID=1871048 RepID=UPI0025B8129B|nr:hypothetical protein [Devosia sp.]